MNETTFDKLEFDKIRAIVASFCATSLGKELARSLTPSTKPKLVRQWLGQVRELNTVIEDFGPPPLAGVRSIRDEVRAAAFPTTLEASMLADVAETLAATADIATWIRRVEESAPSLKNLFQRIADLSSIAVVIYENIDPRGEIRDFATPKLASLRESIADAKRRIRTVVERIVRQPAFARMLQYDGATFHNDRMVIPLKAEYRGRIQGIIHRSSDTGATLFVEPAESVELNNTIARLRDAESKEVTRILRGLSQRVAANERSILATLQALGVLDLIAAKCRYAKARACTCPTINEDGIVDLHEAKHPLLVELFGQEATEGAPARTVVPIDVRLGDDFDVLVITGPNTGGKTVTLKTVGVLAIMTQCGIPIPVAQGSTMPVFREIFVDIGDEQSIHQSLSTFSSHLTTLLAILRESGPDTLVLIDELGAGTDPDEGAAIGQAIICELLKLKSRCIVTTHLSSLKAVAFTESRVDNAAVEFDPESLRPTYHVRLGEPGNSNALIIAKRLGMPARLVQHAKNCLTNKTQALSRAIEGTLVSRRKAEEARRESREAAIEADQSRQELERQARELRQSREAYERWAQWVNTLRSGDVVYIKSLKRQGRVVRMQLQQQTVLVSAGAMDVEIPLREIDLPQDEQV